MKDLHLFFIVEEVMFLDQVNLYLVQVIFSNKMCFERKFHDVVLTKSCSLLICEVSFSHRFVILF